MIQYLDTDLHPDGNSICHIDTFNPIHPNYSYDGNILIAVYPTQVDLVYELPLFSKGEGIMFSDLFSLKLESMILEMYPHWLMRIKNGRIIRYFETVADNSSIILPDSATIVDATCMRFKGVTQNFCGVISIKLGVHDKAFVEALETEFFNLVRSIRQRIALLTSQC